MVETGFYCSVMFVKKKLNPALQFSTGSSPQLHQSWPRRNQNLKHTYLHLQSDTLAGMLASWFLWVLTMVKWQYSLFPFPFLPLLFNIENIFFMLLQQGHSQRINPIAHRCHTQGEFLTATSCVSDMLLILMESKGPH